MKFGILECHHEHIGDFVNQMLRLGHEFIGICDTDSDLAAKMAKRYGVPLLNDAEGFFALKPDVVGTSAINSNKIDIVEQCKAHGAHVMADKPIVVNMDGYQRLKRIVDEDVVQVGLMLTERFNPPVYTLWEMVSEGHLGDLISMSFIKPHKLNAATRASWHFSKEQNGGIVIDLLIHDFDLLHWFTGSDMDECFGYVRKSDCLGYEGFYDSVHILAKMKNGVIATLGADWWMPDSYWTWGDGRIFCVGSEGRAEVKTVGDWLSPKEPYGVWVSNHNDAQLVEVKMPPVTLAQDFLERISGKGKGIISGQDILKASYAVLSADQQMIETSVACPEHGAKDNSAAY